ncbi:MAG: Brp/Blh family beta-carotene 15,15'-dioxygenase [Flavobacteriaceae bacterium]
MIFRLKKYQFHILTTFTFILVKDWLNVSLQLFFALLLIFSVGLMHGANDIQLIQRKTLRKTQSFFYKTLVLYVAVVLFGILLFYFFPTFGLLFFVLFSAFHFGEQHLESLFHRQSSVGIKFTVYTSYGIALFGLLFTLQWDTVHSVIYQISAQFVSKKFTETMFFIGLGVFVFCALWIRSLRQVVLFEILLLAFIGLLFSRLSLILGFALYFVVWHSFPSVQDQLNFLYPNDDKAKRKYILSSLPYWLLSIIGLFGVYFFFDIKSDAFFPLFFSFLAAITFPHTVVMGWLKLSEQKD